MKKELASKSAFFTPRVVTSLAFCAICVLVALLAFSLYSGGYAFAENPDASNNHGMAMSGIGFRTTTASVHSQPGSGKNPTAEKYNTLCLPQHPAVAYLCLVRLPCLMAIGTFT